MTRLQLLRRRLGLDPAVGAPTFHITTDREDEMTSTSTAHVPTQSGSRYLQQLAKHWSHSLNVEFTPEHSRIVFPKDSRGATWADDAVVTMDAKVETLDVTINASSPEHLEQLKGVVARHLDRFAFREAPLTFVWG
jgi:hypothetical protein